LAMKRDYEQYDNFRWSIIKNTRLKAIRGVGFDEILKEEYLGALEHHQRKNQRLLLFLFNEYVWVIPCVIEDECIFLKTLFPSRKYMKLYERGELS